MEGHSIEVRVYAEDPCNEFLPDIGELSTYIRPEGPGVRVDDGFEEGMQIPIHYDPMIAKLVVHAEDRNAAIEKMTDAIDAYQIHGIETTLSFCKFAINHSAFVSGNFDTNFVKHHFQPSILESHDDIEDVAALLAAGVAIEAGEDNLNVVKPEASVWKQLRTTK